MPGDYGFQPPINPRPWKSLCDVKRSIAQAEAQELLRQGVLMGLFSNFLEGEMPKYVWSVDAEGQAYEAKLGRDGYHGYPLEEDDDFRSVVLKEWSKRCRQG
jgi:hypothetical protein